MQYGVVYFKAGGEKVTQLAPPYVHVRQLLERMLFYVENM